LALHVRLKLFNEIIKSAERKVLRITILVKEFIRFYLSVRVNLPIIDQSTSDLAIGSNKTACPNFLTTSKRDLRLAIEIAILHNPYFVAIKTFNSTATQLDKSECQEKIENNRVQLVVYSLAIE
jgi:hypothetical protein